MRLRPRTIRCQLVALLLAPMFSLAALWSYSSVTTVRGALVLIRVTALYRYYGVPSDQLAQALQKERLAAVRYTASGGGSGRADLEASERQTDAQAAALSWHLTRSGASTTLTSEQHDRISALLTALDYLPRLREQVDVGTTNWSDVLDRYSWVIEPEFRLRSSLTALQTGQVAQAGSVAIELGRARELLSREDAMVNGARSAGGMTDGQYRDLIGTIDGRKLLHEIYAPELPSPDAEKLNDFENGNASWSLHAMEEAARTASPPTVTRDVPEQAWRRCIDAALAQLADVDQQAARQVGEQAHATGMSVLIKAAVVSLAGLAAVVASLLVSLRITRRIAGRLTALRDAAEESSIRRLPEIMRRLRDGEPLGDLQEGPPGRPDALLGDDEIGQVGRAFQVAQRAAIQAAVEQARLRRGVSAVFTTLARRSQVLLHRQLSLLDTMERRTEDPAELADLFRLDHMTTRMRRHSEGLLILSGNAPGRAWRHPVRLTHVVRSAVGEVEQYKRVVVRRMPPVALVGSAVADVIHLLAELIENATVFSPPLTDVVVRGERTADGFTVEVEDNGLGMSREVLEQANRDIEDAVGSELPETDRLGLFTVGRLAARHSVRVVLRPATKGGTTAVVMLPNALLAPPDEADEAEDTIGQRLEAIRLTEPSACTTGGPTGTRLATPVATAAGTTAGSTSTTPTTRRPAPGTVAAAPARAGTSAAAPALTTRNGLPLRVRRGTPAQRLKDTPVDHDRPDQERPDQERPAGPDKEDKERSPEAARSTMAAYARGLARGRARTAAATATTTTTTQTTQDDDGGTP